MNPEPMTLDEFAAQAAARWHPAVQAYIDGGAADEHSLGANRRDWADWSLWPRVLGDLGEADTRVRLGRRVLAHPIFLAPVAYHRLVHPDGEYATALAAAAQGAGMVLSCQSSVAVETVAQAFAAEPGAGPLWFQLHAQPDPAQTLALARRAEAAGCEALVLTVDAPVHGVRDRERRSGWRLPPGVEPVHLGGNLPVHDHIEPLLRQALNWDTLSTLQQATRLPLWLKGVLHPLDARRAADAGVAGLIVSNHGGRTLDTAVSTAWALPHVVDAVGGRCPVWVDGGIRRGTDVLKALALGAGGVLLGRPQLHALACGGPMGVARMLRLLRQELQTAMALSGCARLSDVSRALLVPRPRGP